MKDKIDLTIKPTMGCNMKCKHCFNGNAFVTTDMLKVTTAIELVKKACREYKNIKIIFHGGEPSLAGLHFYKTFFERIKSFEQQYGTRFNILFTTNGLLLTDEFIDLLNANSVFINISFDGPYNDLLRQKTKIVQDIIFKVRDKGGKFRCFCTLSKQSVPRLKEIYDWFKYNKLNFKTLPVERRGYAKTNDKIIMEPTDLVSQFETVYRYWLTDKECQISYSTFEEFANLRRNVQYRKFWFGRKIALNPDGKLYVFGRPNDVNYEIGTPYDIEKISECFESKGYIQYLNTLEKIRNSRCSKCESSVVCGGVNINIAHLYVDEMQLIDQSCIQSNMIFQRILNVNDLVITDFRNGKSDKYNSFIQNIYSDYINC
ncbi:MAG: radical SAM protein [Muribaculaceae bacterium]|nr:radical SAM protein [Muribaculaceae bacterium]